jgi:hypothetical protein
MSREHWFDILSKAATVTPTRRRFARALAALVPGLLLGNEAGTVAAKQKKRGNGGKKGSSKNTNKNKGKHKDRPAPAPSDEGPPQPIVGPPDACEMQWPGPDQQGDRDHCRFIRGQCEVGVSRQFCIVEGDPTDPAKVAVCCNEAAVCCGDRCCGDSRHPGRYQCCDGACVDTWNSNDHCGGCGDEFKCLNGWGNGSHEVCVNGSCVCARELEGWTRNDACGGCFPTNSSYYCCDANGYHCLITHDCIALGTNPDGSTSYGCAGRPSG